MPGIYCAVIVPPVVGFAVKLTCAKRLLVVFPTGNIPDAAVAFAVAEKYLCKGPTTLPAVQFKLPTDVVDVPTVSKLVVVVTIFPAVIVNVFATVVGLLSVNELPDLLTDRL